MSLPVLSSVFTVGKSDKPDQSQKVVEIPLQSVSSNNVTVFLQPVGTYPSPPGKYWPDEFSTRIDSFIPGTQPPKIRVIVRRVDRDWGWDMDLKLNVLEVPG